MTTARGAAWDPSRDVRRQRDWDAHAAYFDGLVDRRVVILGGPIDGGEDEVALLAVETTDEAAVRSVFDAGPWVMSGVLRLKAIRRWALWLDSRDQPNAD